MPDARAVLTQAWEMALGCYRAGRLAECKRLCLEILGVDPTFGEVWDRLAHVEERTGNWNSAIAHYERAAGLLARPGEAHNNAAVLLQKAGDLSRAAMHYEEALRHGPPGAVLHSNYGCLLRDLGRLEEAIQHLERALSLDPNLAQAHANLGSVLGMAAAPARGMIHLRRAVELEPDHQGAWNSLLCALNYADDVKPAEAAAQARAYGDRQAVRTPPRVLVPADPNPDRPLRVGWTSADFRQHSVKYFLEPLLAARDRAGLTFVAYSDVLQPDAVTRSLAASFDEWRDTGGASDDDLLARIDADRIDILIDLSGHTAGNRLSLYARRAAPVQLSYAGYPATTGLPTMDGRITDAWADPPGRAEMLHTEKLLRMPRGFLCYAPVGSAPDPVPPPSLAAGHITFGTFNQLRKLSPAILRLWGRVLAAVPGSRLVCKNIALGDEPTRRAFTAELERLSLPLHRIDLRGPTPGEHAHLASYADLDVALDTWPYHGTTTTCEALWMGVPVVTLAGDAHASRVGVSLLNQVGLPHLVATSANEYLACLGGLAADGGQLAQLRTALRRRVQDSPLFDGAGQSRAFQDRLRQAWRACVAGRPNS